MSFVVAVPEVLGTAATDLAGLGSSLSEARAAAATQTTGVLAAAEDEVSAAIAAVFSGPRSAMWSADHGRAFRSKPTFQPRRTWRHDATPSPTGIGYVCTNV